MVEREGRTGRCLCGNVGVSLRTAAQFDACHCGMCRRWGGGPLLAVEADGDVRFEGREHITIFESSDWAERGFCSRCGTHLFYRLKDRNHYVIPVGLLDDPGPLRFDTEIFVDEQPEFYAFEGDRTRLTGAELFDQERPSSEDDGQEPA